jgi:hypothetical protein
MWFAALAGSQQNPWFIHLIKKLLDGCEDVCQLVGDKRLLRGRKMKKLRANLYHYDFTRLDTEWNQLIPNAEIVGLNRTFNHSLLSFLKRPNKYWKRKMARTYLTPMESDNHPIQEFLTGHGYKSTCTRNQDRCETTPSMWCQMAVQIRLYHLYLFPAVLLLIIIAVRRTSRLPRKSILVSTSKKDQ